MPNPSYIKRSQEECIPSLIPNTDEPSLLKMLFVFSGIPAFMVLYCSLYAIGLHAVTLRYTLPKERLFRHKTKTTR